MTETTPTHAEDPAEGADSDAPDDSGRTPHPEQPAEGGDPGEADTQDRAAGGLDPENRVTGI